MNFIQKCKSSAGFTLVELIVVIAILAILAGVAVPAYTGYIAKAEEAADQQLLGAVNTAFAAACLEQGVDAKNVNDADIKLETAANGEGKVVDSITKITGVDATVSVFNDAFQRYFAGNTTSAFKVIERLEFEYGVFVDPTNSPNTHTEGSYKGSPIYVSKQDANALNLSTYMTNAQLGAEGLTSKLGEVSDFASIIYGEGGSDAYNAVLSSPEFANAFMSYLGAESDEEVTAKLDKMVADAGGDESVIDRAMANATVLFAAQNAQNMSSEDINAMFADGAKDVIIGNLNNKDTTTAMSQAALAYGMYTAYAYANDTGDGKLIDKTKNPIDILNGLDDDEFQKYMASDAGKADLEGYLAGMNMITSGAQDSGVSSDVLVNGFATTDLAGLLNSVTGNN